MNGCGLVFGDLTAYLIHGIVNFDFLIIICQVLYAKDLNRILLQLFTLFLVSFGKNIFKTTNEQNAPFLQIIT